MVDVELTRFPWTFSEVKLPPPGSPDAEPVHVGYRVRLDFLIHEDTENPFSLHLDHFTSQSDLLDNFQLAVDCGVCARTGHCHIIVTPKTFSHIYKQIHDYVSKSNLH